MERRLLLVFALTFLVIMLFQPLLKKYGPQPPAKSESAAEPRSAGQPVAAVPALVPESDASLRSAGRTNASVPTQTSAPQVAASESETVIENDVYRIVFTNRGGRVKSWVLKKYTDDKDGQLELVNTAAAQKYGYPLTLWTYDEMLRNKLNSVLYVANSTGAKAPAEVTFAYDDGDVSVQKSYKFDSNSYVVGMRTSVEVHGAQVTAFPMWPAGFGSDMNGPQYATDQIVYQYDDKVERLAIKKISGANTLQGPFHWAGVSDQYFAAVFLPQDPKNAAMVTLRNAIEIPHGGSDPKQMDKVDVLGAAVGSLKGPTDARLYVGPKALADLESVAVPGITGAEPDLRAIIDFGWLGIIALRLSQMKSMLKMQGVAPQIKSIQEKYKKYRLGDPRKAQMNEEISALYKKEG